MAKIFTDSINRKFSEDDFNNLERLPDGTKFFTLDLSYSQVKRLPANLQVIDELDLSHTEVTELPPGIVLDSCFLNLNHSQVRRIEDDTSYGGLCLINSNLDYLGSNISVRNTLYCDPFLKVNGSIACNVCKVYKRDNADDGDFDLGRISHKTLSITDLYGTAIFRNARANYCHIACNCTEEKNFTFIDCTFDKMAYISKVSNNCDLTLKSSVTIRELQVSNVSGAPGVLVLNLDKPTIAKAKIVTNPRDNIVVPCLTLFGDLDLSSCESKEILPDCGVVYGDLTIFQNFTIPPNFCVMGAINYV